MHYTSWDRTDRDHPVLLAEAGPEQLAVFSEGSAKVGDAEWTLEADTKTGATATLPDGRVFHVDGNLQRGTTLPATFNGREFTLVKEDRSNWVIVDAADNKVGQFSGANSGVRQALTEFEGQAETALSRDEIIALSWATRLVLENRLNTMAMAVIGSFVLASIVALVNFFV